MSKTKIQNFCECYKKLSLYGIPQNENDNENTDYEETRLEIEYGNALKFPKKIRINDNVREYPNVEHEDLSDVFE